MECWLKYREWLDFPDLDEEIRQELLKISENEEEITSCFLPELKFGTGGIRGPMGVGPSRLNIYVIRKVSEGVARFIQKNSDAEGSQHPSVVIAYDTRHNSERFALEAASVFICWQIKVHLFSQPAPTPLLSFAVRELGATAGIVITASHNPACDNGYKVYWSDGGQITDGLAAAITTEIAAVGNELHVNCARLDDAGRQGLLAMLEEEIFSRYLEQMQSLKLFNDRAALEDLKIVYTPLHGTGIDTIPRVLQAAGLNNLILVPEQSTTTPSAWTIESPNPEDWTVFDLAIQEGEKTSADLLLATDLDADRLGVAAKTKEHHFAPLTGNQLGGLLLEYILSRKKEAGELPSNGIVIKTVVTSEIGRAIASAYGLETIETLTGFKYIGEMIKELAATGNKTFLFGYEESCGYLLGDFVRDKDALQASQVTAEMAAFYKKKGMTLLMALEHLFQKYGYYVEELVNLSLKAGERERVKKIMDYFRQAKWEEIGGRRLLRRADYLSQEIIDYPQNKKTPTRLPASNSLKYFLERKAWFCIRPSGTEPKLKIYLGVKEESDQQARHAMENLKGAVLHLLEKI